MRAAKPSLALVRGRAADGLAALRYVLCVYDRVWLLFSHRGILIFGCGHVGVGYVHVAVGFFRRFSPIFADVCRLLRIHLPGSLGDFSHVDPKSSKSQPGYRFRSPGAFFFFGFLAFFSSIWPSFRRCSSNLGRFRPEFLFSRSISCNILKNMQFCCFAKHSHHTPM